MFRSIAIVPILAFTIIVSADDVKENTDARQSTTPDDIVQIAKGYPQLQLITKDPVLVNPQLAMLCMGPMQSAVEQAKKTAGPHANTAIKIYMNDLAAHAFGKSTHYPVGAVIVKEKAGQGYIADGGKPAATPSGVGGMIKRAKGFDPDHGDWEYFYFADREKIESGKISSCVQCHAGAATKDYVFGSWAKP